MLPCWLSRNSRKWIAYDGVVRSFAFSLKRSAIPVFFILSLTFDNQSIMQDIDIHGRSRLPVDATYPVVDYFIA